MNAYELADEMQMQGETIYDHPLMIESANMLRQQADRIAELEKKTEYYWDGQPDNAVIIRAIPKPLSDEEILKMKDMVPYSLGSDLIEFARAIEAKVRGQ
jgi:hypothetical protein